VTFSRFVNTALSSAGGPDSNNGNRSKKRQVFKVLGFSTAQPYMRPGHPVTAAKPANGALFMKLGFICLNQPGHLNPMAALARQL
jgi:hypothetical protein